MKIATYNANSIRSRLHIVLPWLKENRPDFFCLQETKVADDKFPAAEFADLGYQAVFKGKKQHAGVAIVSRKKPQKVVYGLDDDPADTERLIAATYEGLIIINTYVPQGQDRESTQYKYKLDWLRRLRKYLEKKFLPSSAVVWCGDLNVAPEKIDVHDPTRIIGHVCFNPEVWKAYEDVKAWGLVDIFRRHHPDEPGQYTFFDYRVRDAVERKLGWRVDHILATAELAGRSYGCQIDLSSRMKEKPSDHAIVYAEFKGN